VDVWGDTLPRTEAGGWMIDYPWDLIEHNGELLQLDYRMRSSKQDGTHRSTALAIIGPPERLVLDPTARVEPYVVLDTTPGPIILDRDVVVQAFTRIEGPCYLGPGTQVFGAKIKGSSIGPMCRVGGEVEASIMHAFSNKYHDGFLGHSYVGEWVNLAAGTQTSDLRNDYGPVPVTINQRRINTGQTKVGAFIGDHTKTALGSLLNTGTVVGAFSNLLPAGGLLPKVVPSFCKVLHGQVCEVPDIEPLFKTAAIVMQRRGREFTDVQAAFFRRLYQETAAQRQEALHAGAPSRLRAGA
jgi:UDP-N-acetylglucosamine diphosphorylase/glucosamine-1-phosphate N-acetyltransferase